MNKENDNKKTYESDGFFDDIPAIGESNFSGANGENSGYGGSDKGDFSGENFGGDNEVKGANGGKGSGDRCGKKTTGKRILSFILTFVMAAFVFFAGYCTYHFASRTEVKNIDEILRIIDAVAYDYTENGEENPDRAIRYFVKGLLYYDDYAEYYGKEEFAELMRESEGSYSGLGMTFIYDTDGSVKKEIYSVIGNSPAARAGVKAGDVIIGAKKTGEEDFAAISSGEEAFKFLQTVKENESADFKFLRGETTFTATMTRSAYKATYITYRDAEGEIILNYDEGKLGFTENTNGDESFESDVAYISLSSFEGEAAEQMKAALDEMQKRGKNKLILDLRANGGGYMTVLEKIVKFLVKSDENIVYSYVKEKGRDTLMKTRSEYADFLAGITVLADGGTASASECLIGAMISYGSKSSGNGFSASDVLVEYNPSRGDYSTYGKGIMQTTYMLSSGGALKLTTAKIFWADGTTCIHGTGVKAVSEENKITAENALSRARGILAGKNKG